MLESLGMNRHAEMVYRAMFAHPDKDVAELASELAVAQEEIRQGLSQLSELALIQPSEHTNSGYHAINPEAAMELLLARQQSELAFHQSRVEASRAAAAQLVAECCALRPRINEANTEHLIGPDAIRERLADLGRTAEDEVMTLAPGGAHSDADLQASRDPNTELFSRGVRIRTIYLDSVRNHQLTLDHVEWLTSQGGQVRTALTLPVRMIILDKSRAVLPTDLADAQVGAVIVTSQGIVAALCALFESIWETAIPLGSIPPRDGEMMSPQEAGVVRLLAQGLTDEAIARNLGVSPRTARRIAAELLVRLDARSRFEAGVHAVQDGWLPSTR